MSATTRIALKALAISASSLALMYTAPAMAQRLGIAAAQVGRLQRAELGGDDFGGFDGGGFDMGGDF